MKKIWRIVSVVIVLVVGFVAFKFVFPINVYGIKGDHMAPALKDGQKTIIVKGDTNYQRGDIVVFPDPTGRYESIVDRVIGLPGEIITVNDSRVYINGKMLDEPYASGVIETIDITLGSNQYYMLGDNRSISLDSRILGPISKDKIIGKLKSL